MSRNQIESAVQDALAHVDDPCSIRANAPLNIIELGLVQHWSVEDGVVRVTVSPTAPSCILMGSIVDGVRERVSAVPGVREVQVTIDGSIVWTPDMMSGPGREKLEQRRQGSMTRAPVRPRQWAENQTITPRATLT